MELSFSLVPSTPLREYIDLAERMEGAGFDRLWVPDQGFHRDPFVTLALAAVRLKRMRLGVAVTNAFSRNPMQVARAAAAAAEYHGHGMIIGFGAGEKRMREALGAREGKFVEVTRDAIVAIKDLLQGKSVTVVNDVFQLKNAELEFKPIEQFSLYVASTSSPAFRMAGEVADGVIIGDVADPDAMREAIKEVRAGATAVGRDPDQIKIVCWATTICTDDPKSTFSAMRKRLLPVTIGTMGIFSRQILGITPEVYSAARSAFISKSAVAEESLPDSLIGRLAIVGPPEAIARRLGELAETGVHTMGMRMANSLGDARSFKSNLTRLAEEVLPKIRKSVSLEERLDAR